MSKNGIRILVFRLEMIIGKNNVVFICVIIINSKVLIVVVKIICLIKLSGFCSSLFLSNNLILYKFIFNIKINFYLKLFFWN